MRFPPRSDRFRSRDGRGCPKESWLPGRSFAARAVVADGGSKAPRYCFLEREINAGSYFLLQQQKKAPEALRLFRINTGLFPASWNVWDSLGEGLLAAVDRAAARAACEKSVQLNPESRNGREALARSAGDGTRGQP